MGMGIATPTPEHAKSDSFHNIQSAVKPHSNSKHPKRLPNPRHKVYNT